MGQIFTIFLIAIAAAVLLLLTYRWSLKSRAGRDRQRLEDGLKHLFDLEYRGRHGSLASLSGALGVADSRGAQSRTAVLPISFSQRAHRVLPSRGSRFAVHVPLVGTDPKTARWRLRRGER